MSTIRLSKVLKELNIGLDRAVETLAEKGHDIENNRNTKISDEQYQILLGEFEQDRSQKEESEHVSQLVREEKEHLRAEKEAQQQQHEPQPEVKDDEAAATEETAQEPATTEEEKPASTPVEEPIEKKEEEPVEKKTVTEKEEVVSGKAEKLSGPKVLKKIDLEPKKKKKTAPAAKKEEEAAEAPAEQESAEAASTPEKAAEEKTAETVKEAEKPQDETLETKYIKLSGPTFTGKKIDLPEEKPKKKTAAEKEENKRKRRRIKKVPGAAKEGQRAGNKGRVDRRKKVEKVELTDEEIQKQIKETLEKLTSGKKSKGAKFRREKRAKRKEQEEMEGMQREEESKVLKVTEFVTATELANMMSVPVNQVISSLMSLGVMVTMNQRLDAEILTLVAEEFGFEVQFVDQEVTETFQVEEDAEEDLQPRAPIVTVMGHVDHGKTSLLDYIRSENVIAGEAGGITQHIGAYSVKLKSGDTITFLDTPGHEAFTAMRARGAQVTDIAIIVVAADDAVMPQTKEAISHAQAAEVPIVFAINKVDRPQANPDKIKEQLAGMNLLVEDWGGKIQSHDISAKTGQGVKELLEKVLLEAELLDLKANPDRNAAGTVVEASLDKGRGYVTTILVESGTLNMGDYVLAGEYSGKVKAMLDERGQRMKKAGPSSPVSLLGLDGAPTAGDRFVVMDDEREAKQIATKRMQLQREQSVRSQKKMTLEEIGRRLAIGDFQELNIVLKGDVDGSIEALSDSLQKLSTEEIAVNIVHKGVGQITESDVLLASASDAVIVGFQVRPSASARKIAERESVDIRLYSIIYDAINEIKDAMEGMLSPDVKEEITGSAEIRETFKISKVGTIAGCMVTEGTINRNNSVRLIREGVVIYTGELGSLKRFKDDVKEVQKGYECGLNIQNFNDIKVGDVVEAFEEVEVKKTLD
jgi:translation initiation factor IF-2